MDRPIIYAGANPRSADLLGGWRSGVEGLGWLITTVLGTTPTVEGMAVGPSAPAGLKVVVQPGAIYAPLALDAASYGTLTADSHVVMQQGLLRDALTLTLTPPATAGQSRVYLVQAACQVVDTDPSVLPYYNSADPSASFNGPSNSGTQQNTRRAVQAVVNLKAGTPAATGSEVAPSPDAGFVALAAVTVPNGASTVASGNIVANTSLRQKVAALPDLKSIFGGAGLLNPNGWMTLPGGLILQWGGFVTSSGAAAQIPVTFPVAFPNAFFIAGATLNNSTTSLGGIATYQHTLTSMAVSQSYSGGQTGTLSFFWWALGR